jgi:hypothetical protein
MEIAMTMLEPLDFDTRLAALVAPGGEIATVTWTEHRVDPGTAARAVVAHVIPWGPARVAVTTSAGDWPYAAIHRATTAIPSHVDLLWAKAVPVGALPGEDNNRIVRRDERFRLVLASPNEDPFERGLSGDARRWRGLMRETGARLERVSDADRPSAVRMIAQLHHAAATQRGLVSDAQVGDRTAVVERLATHPAARAYLLVGSAGDLLAGTFGLVRGETFYGLVSGGLTEGVAGKKSANRLVKLAALDAMRAEGIRAYDFGIGETAEKQQLCDTREAIVDLIVPFTLIGHGLAPLLGAHVAMRASAKRNGLGEVLRRWRRAHNTAPYAWPRLPAAIWRGNGKPRSAGRETSC